MKNFPWEVICAVKAEEIADFEAKTGVVREWSLYTPTKAGIFVRGAWKSGGYAKTCNKSKPDLLISKKTCNKSKPNSLISKKNVQKKTATPTYRQCGSI